MKKNVVFTIPLNFFIGDVSIRKSQKGGFRYYLYVEEKSRDEFLYSRWVDYATAEEIINKHGCDEWENTVTGKHTKKGVLNKYFNH